MQSHMGEIHLIALEIIADEAGRAENMSIFLGGGVRFSVRWNRRQMLPSFSSRQQGYYGRLAKVVSGLEAARTEGGNCLKKVDKNELCSLEAESSDALSA